MRKLSLIVSVFMITGGLYSTDKHGKLSASDAYEAALKSTNECEKLSLYQYLIRAYPDSPAAEKAIEDFKKTEQAASVGLTELVDSCENTCNTSDSIDILETTILDAEKSCSTDMITVTITKSKKKIAAFRKAVRSKQAQALLAQAGNLTSSCAKGEIYEKVIEEYPELDEAKFAKKGLKSVTADIIRILQKSKALFPLVKTVQSEDEKYLNQHIDSMKDFKANCPVKGVSTDMESIITFLEKYRLKTFGY